MGLESVEIVSREIQLAGHSVGLVVVSDGELEILGIGLSLGNVALQLSESHIGFVLIRDTRGGGESGGHNGLAVFLVSTGLGSHVVIFSSASDLIVKVFQNHVQVEVVCFQSLFHFDPILESEGHSVVGACSLVGDECVVLGDSFEVGEDFGLFGILERLFGSVGIGVRGEETLLDHFGNIRISSNILEHLGISSDDFSNESTRTREGGNTP